MHQVDRTSFAAAVSPACSIRSAASPIIVVSSGLPRRTLWYNVTARNGSPALRAWSKRASTALTSSCGSSTWILEVSERRCGSGQTEVSWSGDELRSVSREIDPREKAGRRMNHTCSRSRRFRTSQRHPSALTLPLPTLSFTLGASHLSLCDMLRGGLLWDITSFRFSLS